ncbi:hypothetical protein BJ912DRAFT_1092609 [Pholiota molesta]|nr:hypothetical protein BJ912DRAFT_1092609 [Pholiota molesta]
MRMARPKAINYLIQTYARYAILSHTWLQKKPEIVFEDARIQEAGEQFKPSGVQPMESWKDSVISPKRSSECHLRGWTRSASIKTAPRSSKIHPFYVSLYPIHLRHLPLIPSLADMHLDRWFTRGWTLQELLAPKKIKFYNKLWDSLTTSENDKIMSSSSGRMMRQKRVTGFPTWRHGPWDCLANGMGGQANYYAWRGPRLLSKGVFNVSFSIAYGEGAQRAFFRLLEAILTAFSNPLDILNWPPSFDSADTRFAHAAFESGELPQSQP